MTTWQRADSLVRQTKDFLDQLDNGRTHGIGAAAAAAAAATATNSSGSWASTSESDAERMILLLRNFVAVTTGLQDQLSFYSQMQRTASTGGSSTAGSEGSFAGEQGTPSAPGPRGLQALHQHARGIGGGGGGSKAVRGHCVRCLDLLDASASRIASRSRASDDNDDDDDDDNDENENDLFVPISVIPTGRLTDPTAPSTSSTLAAGTSTEGAQRSTRQKRNSPHKSQRSASSALPPGADVAAKRTCRINIRKNRRTHQNALTPAMLAHFGLHDPADDATVSVAQRTNAKRKPDHVSSGGAAAAAGSAAGGATALSILDKDKMGSQRDRPISLSRQLRLREDEPQRARIRIEVEQPVASTGVPWGDAFQLPPPAPPLPALTSSTANTAPQATTLIATTTIGSATQTASTSPSIVSPSAQEVPAPQTPALSGELAGLAKGTVDFVPFSVMLAQRFDGLRPFELTELTHSNVFFHHAAQQVRTTAFSRTEGPAMQSHQPSGSPSVPTSGSDAATVAVLTTLRLLAATGNIAARFDEQGTIASVISLLSQLSQAQPFEFECNARSSSSTPSLPHFSSGASSARSSPAPPASSLQSVLQAMGLQQSSAPTSRAPTPHPALLCTPATAEASSIGWGFAAQMATEAAWCLGNILQMMQNPSTGERQSPLTETFANPGSLNALLKAVATLGQKLVASLVLTETTTENESRGAPLARGTVHVYNGTPNTHAAAAQSPTHLNGHEEQAPATPTQYMLQMMGRRPLPRAVSAQCKLRRLQQQALRQFTRTTSLLLNMCTPAAVAFAGTDLGARNQQSSPNLLEPAALQGVCSFACLVALRRCGGLSPPSTTAPNSDESSLAMHDALAILLALVTHHCPTAHTLECATQRPSNQAEYVSVRSALLQRRRPFVAALVATLCQRCGGGTGSSGGAKHDDDDDVAEQQIVALQVVAHTLRIAPTFALQLDSCLAEHLLQLGLLLQNTPRCPALWHCFARLLGTPQPTGPGGGSKRQQSVAISTEIFNALVALLRTRVSTHATDKMQTLTNVAQMVADCPHIYKRSVELLLCRGNGGQEVALAALKFLSRSLSQLYSDRAHVLETRSGGAIEKLLVMPPIRALAAVVQSMGGGMGGWNRAGAGPEYVLAGLSFMRQVCMHEQQSMSALTTAANAAVTRTLRRSAHSNPNSPSKPVRPRSFPGEGGTSPFGGPTTAATSTDDNSDDDDESMDGSGDDFVLVDHGPAPSTLAAAAANQSDSTQAYRHYQDDDDDDAVCGDNRMVAVMEACNGVVLLETLAELNGSSSVRTAAGSLLDDFFS
eukprot:INCI1292.1.p1 GENE.INCI1292.1~~INCI1292.1.p1  ORF type:complete len:1304 (-),score=220.83 INCI1292.1:105-4016(-)